MGERGYYIGEAAKKLAVSQRTIRYYEELGFLSPTRTEGHFRIYTEAEINRLAAILYLKELGLSLEDIGALLRFGATKSVHDISVELSKRLVATKKEFETKLTKYQNGVKEMQHILELIKECVKCKREADHGVCHDCIDKKDDNKPPLVKCLF